MLPRLLSLVLITSQVTSNPINCPAFEPFRCPEEQRCISIQYLCDGAADCSDGYDEDARLCTAARRPPVEETSSFLKSLLASHGPNYLEKLFGPKARNNMQQLGGVDTVAIALSGEALDRQTQCWNFPSLYRICNYRWFWSQDVSPQDWCGAPQVGLHGCGEWRYWHVEEPGYQGKQHVLRLASIKALNFKDSELGDVKFFLEKLVNTGFLD